jgi:hypothetical protein
VRTGAAGDAADAVERQAEELARHPAVERFGSWGLAAKGGLYAVVALLVASIAVGSSAGSGEASQSGAIQSLADQPFGAVLLAVLAVGLASYTALRLLHAVTNPSDEEGARGLLERAGYLVRAGVSAGLLVTTIRQLTGSAGSGDGDQRLTQRVLELPGGPVLVALAALALLALAAHQLHSAATASFMDQLEGASPARERRARAVGRPGYAARAVLFGAIGVLLGRAALGAAGDDAAGGLDEAVQAIATTPGGTAALLVLAVGLACLGAFYLMVAAWGRAREAG